MRLMNQVLTYGISFQSTNYQARGVYRRQAYLSHDACIGRTIKLEVVRVLLDEFISTGNFCTVCLQQLILHHRGEHGVPTLVGLLAKGFHGAGNHDFELVIHVLQRLLGQCAERRRELRMEELVGLGFSHIDLG